MSKLVLFNKPFQVLSQFSSDDGKASLASYLSGKQFHQCYPAGRLDFDSEGLLLLTDDGALQHRIAHPKQKLAKHYWVQVEGEISDADLVPLRNGITLSDFQCQPAKAHIIEAPAVWERNPPVRQRKNQPTSWVEIIISEGKNRQVRRMCAAIQFPCLRLIRHRIGDWQLGELQPGEFQIGQVHLPKASARSPVKKHC